jgi:hypothetical protein
MVRLFGVKCIVGVTPHLVKASHQPVFSLGAEMVTLGLSVDKRKFEP